MEALDRYTFEQWQESNQLYLDAKFALLCNKLDTIKVQRLEDCEDCERHRAECQGRISLEMTEIKDNSKRTTKLLAAGIVLSVLICLGASGVIPIIPALKAGLKLIGIII